MSNGSQRTLLVVFCVSVRIFFLTIARAHSKIDLLFVKLLENIHVFELGPTPCESHECSAPYLTRKDSKFPLFIKAIARNLVEDLQEC